MTPQQAVDSADARDTSALDTGTLAVAAGDDLVRSYDRGFGKAVAVVALLWHTSMLLALTAALHIYTHPLVPVAVWIGLAGIGLCAAPRVADRRLSRHCAIGLLVSLAAAMAIVGAVCPGYFVVGFPNYPALGAGWILMQVAASRPTREWVLGGAAISVVTAVVALRPGIHDALLTSRLGALIWTQWLVLVSISMIRRAVERSARTAAAAAAEESALAGEREAAASVHADRRQTFELLERRTLPLIREIAAGRLDPRCGEALDRCGAEAAALRQRLSVRADRQVHELDALVELAREHGVLVDIQDIGQLAQTPVAARAEIVRTVRAVLDQVPPGRAVLTVLTDTDAASVFVSFRDHGWAGLAGAALARTTLAGTALAGTTEAVPVPRPGVDPAGRVTVIEDVGDGQAVLEVAWSK